MRTSFEMSSNLIVVEECCVVVQMENPFVAVENERRARQASPKCFKLSGEAKGGVKRALCFFPHSTRT